MGISSCRKDLMTWGLPSSKTVKAFWSRVVTMRCLSSMTVACS